MPTNPISTGAIDDIPIVLTASDTLYPDDRNGTLARIDSLPPGASVDDIFFFNINGEYFRRVIDGSLSAGYCGIYADGTDQTANFADAFAAGVKTIVFDKPDGGTYIIDSTLNVPAGVTFSLLQGNKLSGVGTINGATIEADYNVDVIDVDITLLNCLPAHDRWSPIWFGAKGDGIVDDAPAFQKFLELSIASNGGLAEFPIKRTFYFQTDVIIPNFYAGYIPQLIINGNGSTINAVGTDRVIFKKTVSDQSMADSAVNSRIIINSLNFKGEEDDTQTGILLQATYGSQINNCTFWGFRDAIMLQFCLNARLFQNYYFKISNVCDTIRYGSWTGATGNNSQSNQTVVSQNRYYCKTNQRAAVEVICCSNVVLEDCVFEGENPQHNVIFTAIGSTTVQTFYVRRPHIENSPSNTSFSLTPVGGILEIDGPWFQLAHTLVEITQAVVAYATLVIRNVPYIPSTTNLLAQRIESFNRVQWALENWTWSISGTPQTYLDTLFVVDANHQIPYYRHLTLSSNYSSHIYADYGMIGGIISSNNNISVSKPVYLKTNMILDQAGTYIQMANNTALGFIQNSCIIFNAGTTAQRVQQNHSIRVNTDNSVFEGRINGVWYQLNNTALILDEFTIGDAGKPVAGTTTYNNSALIGRSRNDFALFIEGIKIAYDKSDRLSYVLDAEPSVTGTITLLNSYTWLADQVVTVMRSS